MYLGAVVIGTEEYYCDSDPTQYAVHEDVEKMVGKREEKPTFDYGVISAVVVSSRCFLESCR